MTDWDERFRSGQYPQDPDPSPVLERYVDALPAGRALDVAAGTGRNAVFLASAGHEVDAIDQSREGLKIVCENAAERGVCDRLNPIQADVASHAFPAATYDVIAVSFYRAVDRFPDLKEALVPGGVLFVEHHLRTTDAVDRGPSGDRYRFAANELLHACLDLTVLHYEEGLERSADGERSATASIVVRRTSGPRQSYPAVDSTGRERTVGE